MDSKCYKSKPVALKEAKRANKQFKEYNIMLKERNITDRQPIGLVVVKEMKFDRRKNIDW